jgi:multidrug efflux pump subunit AcrB
MKRKLDVVESVMHYKSIMLLILVIGVVFGVYSLVMMPKNEFPSYTIRQGVVVGVYPGATSNEVEEQMTKPLEKFLWGFKEIKKAKTYSESKDGVCYIFVELNDDINDKDEFWSKFKIRLQQFKSSLPTGVLALIANDDFGDTSAMLVTLESKTKTYRQLHNYMTDLQDRLRTIPDVANMRLYGEQQEQIGIYIDRDRLSDYGLNTATLLSALQSQGMTLISGSVDDQNTVRPIHLRSKMNTENDVAQQIVYSDPAGNVIRLRDIATIKREYPDADSYVKNNGKKCIVLSLEMNEGHNIVNFGREVKSVIGDFEKTLPDDVTIYPITDQSNVVNSSVVDFLKELLIAIVSVIVVIMLLLPMRVASVAASTIPITIFISLGIFYACGVELNTVTLAALIVTLGMIVDNSIVIIDCYIEKIDAGMSHWHAASAAAKEFFSSIFSATLAISITFFPLLLTMTGVMKDFVKWFPVGISIILATSLLVAVFVVPLMQFAFIRKGLKRDSSKPRRRTFLEIIQQYYNKLITTCFAHPFITLGVGAASIVVGAVLYSMQPQKLMPRAERNQFAVEIYLPTGTSIERTSQVADSLAHLMKKDPRVLNITTFYGCSSPRFQTSYAPQMGGTNYAQFIVNTADDKATVALLDKFTPEYTTYFSDAIVRFKQLDYSDAAAPVEIRFSGDSLRELHAVVDSAMRIMRADPDLLLVRSNFEGTTDGMSVVMNDDEANRLGINKTMLAMNLATRFGSGIPLTTVWEGDYPVSVMLKDRHAGLQTPADLNNSTVSGIVPGVNVNLRQIADVNPDWSEGMIVRRNGVRTISVFADTQRGLNLNKVTDKTLARLSALHLPAGVTMKPGGQRASDEEYGPQIYNGLAISIIVIFVILLYHFKDIRMSLLIMFSLLFSMLGAAIGVLLMRQEVGLTGTLGMISLMGIIVRNGIIMIDYAEELRKKHHLSAKHAALQAAQRRMRPIFLTSAAASMGVIPMVIQNSPMWGPMGVVVCFGTLIAMLFIITMIPIGYWMIFRIEDKKRHLKNEKERSVMMLDKQNASLMG